MQALTGSAPEGTAHGIRESSIMHSPPGPVWAVDEEVAELGQCLASELPHQPDHETAAPSGRYQVSACVPVHLVCLPDHLRREIFIPILNSTDFEFTPAETVAR